MAIALSNVDVQASAERLFDLVVTNDEDDRHLRAVVAEGGADLWVAADHEALIGALLARPMRADDGLMRGFVDHLLVDGAFRRRGIGSRLLQMAEAHYARCDLDGMQISLRADNRTARALYDSQGYRVVLAYTRRRRHPAERRLRMWKEFQRTGGA